jgi:hypothetical protein
LSVAHRSWRYSLRYPGREQIVVFVLILVMALLSNLLIGHLGPMLAWLRQTLLGVPIS